MLTSIRYLETNFYVFGINYCVTNSLHLCLCLNVIYIMRRDVFQAIADPVRRDIIELLAAEKLTVNEVAEKFEISRPAISKHLKILQECEIIKYDKVGRERICVIQAQNLIPAFLWIKQYNKLWEDRIDSFEEYVNQIQNKKNNNE